MEKLTAECKYCGQINVIPMAQYSSEEEKEVKATEVCNCDEASCDRKIKNACGKIDEMFSIGCESIGLKKLTGEQTEMLKNIVRDIVADNALTDSVTFGFGIKADIKINSKDEIEVKRTDIRASKDVIGDN